MDPPKYKVYSPAGVTWATALGSPAAGGIVLGLNYWKWGKKREAWQAMITGAMMTAGLFALSRVLPDWISGPAYWVPQILGAYAVAEKVQGKRYEAHLQLGGKKASNWLGVVIGVLVMVGGLAAYLAETGVNLRGVLDAQQSVDIGKGNKVYYSRGATRADAQRVGETLKSIGYFLEDGEGVVMIAGRGKEKELSFILMDEPAWDKPAMVEALRQLTEQMAESMGGRPVTMRLLNEKLEEKKRVKVE